MVERHSRAHPIADSITLSRSHFSSARVSPTRRRCGYQPKGSCVNQLRSPCMGGYGPFIETVSALQVRCWDASLLRHAFTCTGDVLFGINPMMADCAV
jgi:hypothetical protein